MIPEGVLNLNSSSPVLASPKAAVMQRLVAARDAGAAPDLDGYPGPWPLPRA